VYQPVFPRGAANQLDYLPATNPMTALQQNVR
jgi:hypothetical protein